MAGKITGLEKPKRDGQWLKQRRWDVGLRAHRDVPVCRANPDLRAIAGDPDRKVPAVCLANPGLRASAASSAGKDNPVR
jgi:hypothetical protein